MAELLFDKIIYSPSDFLGKSPNGNHVYKGTFGDRIVAVKVIGCEPNKEKEAIAEKKALIKCDHENIVKYFAAQAMSGPGGYILLAIELCEITLRTWVEGPTPDNSDNFKDISEAEILCQVTRGLEHLHRRNIVHRDLKPTNILLTHNPDNKICVKIADFGISKTILDGRSGVSLTSVGGSDGWTAPEILQYNELRQALQPGDKPLEKVKMNWSTDVFSLGCVFYYVLSGGKHPFGITDFQRKTKIIAFQPNLGEVASAGNVFLIQKMIASEPAQRWQASDILKYHIFWSPDDKLDFLARTSNALEGSWTNEKSRCLQLLQNCTSEPWQQTFTDWMSTIHPTVADYLVNSGYRSYDRNSVPDLIRAIRNLQNHHANLSDSVKICLGDLPDPYISNWTDTFPELIHHVWLAAESLKLHHKEIAQFYKME